MLLHKSTMCSTLYIAFGTLVLHLRRGSCRTAMGTLLTITRRMNCALSLAGRKINILKFCHYLKMRKGDFSWLTFWLPANDGASFWHDVVLQLG